eukprot:CAMPEP_0206135596 /NCGR_PEP_ID=MMETSP1473-20131121/864_1 /ASSEMBLY_ACC=CAM_ASM_001109 /TAXON_ID=1461547 /ORGANISM="Stichococcus sp, Strain RCC1054" /LENGTH=37 /DNA_ID= /DNA_START= /DNA_END= /DNA_ORIENTATION=
MKERGRKAASTAGAAATWCIEPAVALLLCPGSTPSSN